jgi:predicted dienelactone hydrolase
VLLSACAVADVDDFADPAKDGPYGVGLTTLEWTDDRGKALVADAWYPADVAGEPDPYEPFVMTGLAHRGADRVEGTWPVVAFSHGYSGFRDQSIFLTEWLASHGFVVVAPDHPDNTFFDLDDDATATVMLERPGDISSSVDRVQAEFDVADDFVMMGHSFGAWTTLAVAGGVADFDWMRAFCQANAGYDLCDVDLDPSISTLPAGAPDPRAIGGVSMAPCGWYTFGEDGLAGASDVAVMVGTLDDTCAPDAEGRPTYDELGPGRAYVTVPDAGHFVFSNLCELGDLQPECSADGYIDTDEAQDAIKVWATAWALWRVTGDARYADALDVELLGTE